MRDQNVGAALPLEVVRGQSVVSEEEEVAGKEGTVEVVEVDSTEVALACRADAGCWTP